jgi:hypothetical protein
VLDASGTLAPGAARITVLAPTATPERAVAAATTLGDPRGALASRLAALEAPARMTSVVATARAFGGCLRATLDLAPRDLSTDAPGRIATAAALAREEVAVELADVNPPEGLSQQIVTSSGDPRDAAERAAWWSLAGPRTGLARDAFAVELQVAVADPRDAADTAEPMTSFIRGEIDRATLAWHLPVVEPRVRVERGQGETWIVVGSPCGNLPEAALDAGAGAAVAAAAAASASEHAGDAYVEPFADVDGIGVIVHGAARPGESPLAQARRLADLAARGFAADTIDEEAAAKARAQLLADASTGDALGLAALAGAISPGHPSWLLPGGTAFGLASSSDGSIALRAAAVRTGPLRVAVLANVDAAQADAAAHAVDRWVARRPGEARSCPEPATPSAARPGTYSIDRPPGAPSEVLFGFPLPASSEQGDTTQAAAEWLAAALGGDAGLMAGALGGQPGSDAGAVLARSLDATVLGIPRARALVIRVVTFDDDALEAVVARSSALFDRMRKGGVGEADLQRASSAIATERLATAIAPRGRAIALWRGRSDPTAPTLEAMRSLAAQVFRDETMIVVAVRPPRTVSQDARRGAPRDSKTK